jgi:glucose/arabinose dehydrogenase
MRLTISRLLAIVGWGWLAFAALAEEPAHTMTVNGHQFTLPPGFELELAAGADLVPRPISADFDERGRLYVTDSSGTNEPSAVQLEKKPHRIVRLEDTNGDGKFDKSVVFAERLMFPEGALWHAGSLYVAARTSGKNGSKAKR